MKTIYQEHHTAAWNCLNNIECWRHQRSNKNLGGNYWIFIFTFLLVSVNLSPPQVNFLKTFQKNFSFLLEYILCVCGCLDKRNPKNAEEISLSCHHTFSTLFRQWRIIERLDKKASLTQPGLHNVHYYQNQTANFFGK